MKKFNIFINKKLIYQKYSTIFYFSTEFHTRDTAQKVGMKTIRKIIWVMPRVKHSSVPRILPVIQLFSKNQIP